MNATISVNVAEPSRIHGRRRWWTLPKAPTVQAMPTRPSRKTTGMYHVAIVVNKPNTAETERGGPRRHSGEPPEAYRRVGRSGHPEIGHDGVAGGLLSGHADPGEKPVRHLNPIRDVVSHYRTALPNATVGSTIRHGYVVWVREVVTFAT
jgi:hypothetical protein